MSRGATRYCEKVLRVSGLEVVDLGSRNGVRLNGQRVSSAHLRRGDVVRLGGWLGVVTEGPGAWREIAPGLFGGATLQSALGAVAAGSFERSPHHPRGGDRNRQRGSYPQFTQVERAFGASGRRELCGLARGPRRRVNCSATDAAPSPARTSRARGSSAAPRAAPCCSTR